MLEQLKELLEMQRVLDEAILKEHGNIYIIKRLQIK